MAQPISTKKTEAVHYRYRLNEEKAKAFYSTESTKGLQASINGFILSAEFWSIPRLQKINFGVFANVKDSTKTGIVDEELYIPASKKCISLNGEKYDKPLISEVDEIYSLERLLSFTHEELKEIAEDNYGIKGHFKTEKLREEIIKAQNNAKEKSTPSKQVDSIKTEEVVTPAAKVEVKPAVKKVEPKKEEETKI